MSARVCHCVGHLSNPGGACCQDLGDGKWVGRTYPPLPLAPATSPKPINVPRITEEDVRRIIREMVPEIATAIRDALLRRSSSRVDL